MIINVGGVEYVYDEALIDVRDGIAIREHTGMGLRSWEKAIDDADPVALQALFWIVKKQNGETVPLKTLNFSVQEFYVAVCDAARAEIAEKIAKALAAGETAGEEAADPTETVS